MNHELTSFPQTSFIFRYPRKQLPCDSDIRINNYKLKLHQFVKYLGVLINKVLSWKKQIDNR